MLCTGGFQTASVIAGAIARGACDGVTIARPLIANPDLVRWFERGHDRAPQPCTYCNKCLFNFVENPLGCYEESRFGSREEMVEQIFSVYEAPRRTGWRSHEQRRHLPAARVPEPDGEEPDLPARALPGRFNNYDGTGNEAHVNWDLKFARGGVGAIISSNAPVHPRGLIVPNYAHIDRDETIPFWRELVARVHEHDCSTSSSSRSRAGSATSAASSSRRAGARPTSPSRSTASSASG